MGWLKVTQGRSQCHEHWRGQGHVRTGSMSGRGSRSQTRMGSWSCTPYGQGQGNEHGRSRGHGLRAGSRSRIRASHGQSDSRSNMAGSPVSRANMATIKVTYDQAQAQHSPSKGQTWMYQVKHGQSQCQTTYYIAKFFSRNQST